MSDHSSAVNSSFATTMSEMLERLDAKHETRVDSILNMHAQELEAARRAEASRTEMLKTAYDQALHEARKKRGPCVIA